MSIGRLSAEESVTLYSLLKSEQRPLDDVIADFNSKISRPHHFTVCSNIVWLLEASQSNPPSFFVHGHMIDELIEFWALEF